jgi:hypothetical protein
MIILPENTVRTWGEAVTPDDWLRIHNTLMGTSTSAFIAGKVAVADDWLLLANIALDHYIDITDRIKLHMAQLEAA